MNKNSTDRKKIGLRILLITLPAAAFVFVLVFAGTNLSAQLGELKALSNGLADELRDSRAKLDVITQSLSLLANDSNDMRSQIGMAGREYPISQLIPQTQAEEENPVVQFWTVVERVYDRYDNEQNQVAFDRFVDSEDFQSFLKTNRLVVEEQGGLEIMLFRKLDRYMSIRYLPVTDEIELSFPHLTNQSRRKWQPETRLLVESQIPEIESYYSEARKKSENLGEIKKNPDVMQLLEQKEIFLKGIQEDRESYYVSVVQGRVAYLRVSLLKSDRLFHLAEAQSENLEDLLPAIVAAIGRVDPRSEREKRVGQSQQFLVETFEKTDLVRLLESKKLLIDLQPRENEYFIYYDIKNDQQKIGSFAVDKYTAEVYMTDKDEVQIGSFRSLTGAEPKVKKN